MRKTALIVCAALSGCAAAARVEADAGQDGGAPDSGSPDAGVQQDAGAPDAGQDAGEPDAGSTDGGWTGTPTVLGRRYHLHIPTGYIPGKPTPLLLMFHGYGSSAAGHESYLHFTALADEKTFIYAYPDGLTDVLGQQFWNATDACCDLYDKPTDDVYFVSAILADVQSSWSVDPRRIYAFGHSNGGFMAHRLACDLSQTLAGVVSLAGMTWKDASKCPAKERIAILQIHGDSDGTIKYGGGNVGAPWMASYPSAHETVAHWAATDGCGALEATGETLDLVPDLAGNETSIERYARCAGGAVEIWTVHGGSHQPNLTERWYDPVWSFLAAHPKP